MSTGRHPDVPLADRYPYIDAQTAMRLGRQAQAREIGRLVHRLRAAARTWPRRWRTATRAGSDQLRSLT